MAGWALASLVVVAVLLVIAVVVATNVDYSEVVGLSPVEGFRGGRGGGRGGGMRGMGRGGRGGGGGMRGMGRGGRGGGGGMRGMGRGGRGGVWPSGTWPARGKWWRRRRPVNVYYYSNYGYPYSYYYPGYPYPYYYYDYPDSVEYDELPPTPIAPSPLVNLGNCKIRGQLSRGTLTIPAGQTAMLQQNSWTISSWMKFTSALPRQLFTFLYKGSSRNKASPRVSYDPNTGDLVVSITSNFGEVSNVNITPQTFNLNDFNLYTFIKDENVLRVYVNNVMLQNVILPNQPVVSGGPLTLVSDQVIDYRNIKVCDIAWDEPAIQYVYETQRPLV